MPLFGKKRQEPEVFHDPMKPLPTLEQLQQQMEVVPRPQPRPEPKQVVHQEQHYHEEPHREEKSGAPLFVKLDKYKGLLNAMGYLKTSLVMLKSSLIILKDLDRLRTENLNVLEEGLEKMEKRLATLDSDFLRPSGLREEEVHDVKDVQSLEGTIEDLKGQIEQLKAELESAS